MKVALIVPGFSDGEDDWCIPFLYDLVRGLGALVDLHVFAMRYPTRRDNYPFFDATVHAVGGHHSIQGIQRLPLWARTLALIRAEHRRSKFDLLHGMWAEETGMLAATAARYFHIPSVVTLVGGELVRLPDINYGMKPAADSEVNNWMTTIALSANGVIAPCRSMRTLINHSWLSRHDVIIPFGVDTDLFSPDPRFVTGPPRTSGLFGSRPFPPARPTNPFRRLFNGPDALDDDDGDDDEPRPSLFSSSRPSVSGIFGRPPPQRPSGPNNPLFPRQPFSSDDDAESRTGPRHPNASPEEGRPDEADGAAEPDREDADQPPGGRFGALFSRAGQGFDDDTPDDDDFDDDDTDINDLLDANAYLMRALRRMSEERGLSRLWGTDDDDDDDLEADEAPEPPPFVGAVPHLIAVGSLIPVKNHALLLRAFARIAAKEATLEIVGEGPLLGDLKQLAAALGIADRVTFAGHIPHDKMPEVYRRADLHILTSRHEGFGLVVIEAAACGVPTIGFNVGVLEEMAPAWGTAIEYTIEDELETLLVNRIDDMLTYRLVPLRPLRERVRQVVKERYTLAHMVNGVRSVYVEVLEHGHPVRTHSLFGPLSRPGPPRPPRPPGSKPLF